MKMRYCILISAVVSIIIGGILSCFIEMWASIFLSIFTCYWITIIIKIKSSKLSQNPKFKDSISMCLVGLLALYSEAFGFGYKGEKTIMLGIIVGVIFTICLLILGLILLRNNKNDTK